MDTIEIRGLQVCAYHGVNPEEKRDGQFFLLDITLHTPLDKPGKTDALADTVNYSKAAKLAVRVMREASYDLIERAASRVAQELLKEFPSIRQVDITLKKPEAPIQADFSYVAVSISRRKEDFT